jgi:hypothetical protein
MTQVKKISVATIYGKLTPSGFLKALNQTINIMDVIGVAVGLDKGLSSFGEWEALKGDFSARSLKADEHGVLPEPVRASTCFLPDIALDAIKVALAAPDAKGIEFAMRIKAIYVAEREGFKAGGSVYEYTFEHLLTPSADSDPIARIDAKLAAQAKALAAPKESAPIEEKKVVKAK